MGGIAGMDPALHAAHGPTGTVPTWTNGALPAANLFGGAGNDTLTGGTGGDRLFGQSGDDRMVWNPGDDSDRNEGGDGSDTIEVHDRGQ